MKPNFSMLLFFATVFFPQLSWSQQTLNNVIQAYISQGNSGAPGVAGCFYPVLIDHCNLDKSQYIEVTAGLTVVYTLSNLTPHTWPKTEIERGSDRCQKIASRNKKEAVSLCSRFWEMHRSIVDSAKGQGVWDDIYRMAIEKISR